MYALCRCERVIVVYAASKLSMGVYIESGKLRRRMERIGCRVSSLFDFGGDVKGRVDGRSCFASVNFGGWHLPNVRVVVRLRLCLCALLLPSVCLDG